MLDFLFNMAKLLVKGAKNKPKRDATGPGSQTGEGDSDYCGAESVMSLSDSPTSDNKEDTTKDRKESWVIVTKDQPIVGDSPMLVSINHMKPSKPRDSVTSKAKPTTHTHTDAKTKASRLAREKVRTQKMIERPEVKPHTMQGPAESKKEKDKEAVATDIPPPTRKDAEVEDVETILEAKQAAAEIETVPETEEEAEARARSGQDAHGFVWPK